MNYKLKHLSRFCCRPANETEFEAVKMAAELGGVDNNCLGNFPNLKFPHITVNYGVVYWYKYSGKRELVSVLDFIKKLRMTDEEAKELEDDRVMLMIVDNHKYSSDCMELIALTATTSEFQKTG